MQAGGDLAHAPPAERRALTLGLGLHGQGQVLMREGAWAHALDVLTLAEQAFLLVDLRHVGAIDNVALLLIDLVWCADAHPPAHSYDTYRTSADYVFHSITNSRQVCSARLTLNIDVQQLSSRSVCGTLNCLVLLNLFLIPWSYGICFSRTASE